jgi:hypothetical protein
LRGGDRDHLGEDAAHESPHLLILVELVRRKTEERRGR